LNYGNIFLLLSNPPRRIAMPSKPIPDIVIGRLPIYLRELSFLAAEGIPVTSSHELGKRLGVSAAQIRKDLSHFGEFGKQGTGYNVGYLQEQLRRILKVDHEWPIALVGIGDLGRALAHYGGFVNRGFRIVALFDNDPAKIGQHIGNLEIKSTDRLADVVRELGIRVAMIAVPAASAQKVAEACLAVGIQAILNYAPITLSVPEGMLVQHIDPVAHLQRMTHYL
jgi:redox-sensing transcriptional repressor